MLPIHFEGSREIGKPLDMKDEECSSIWAMSGVDDAGYAYFVTVWQPSYEDLKAMNEGKPICVKSLSNALVPMALYTLDENNEANV